MRYYDLLISGKNLETASNFIEWKKFELTANNKVSIKTKNSISVLLNGEWQISNNQKQILYHLIVNKLSKNILRISIIFPIKLKGEKVYAIEI